MNFYKRAGTPALLFNLNLKMMNSIEDFWEELLSRNPKHIKRAYEKLSDSDQKAVADHLLTMTTEAGWHSAQKLSAQIALRTINKFINEKTN